MPSSRHQRTATVAMAVAVSLALVLCLLAPPDAAEAALQRLAGYERGGDNRFGALYGYLSNLRDAIVPLAIPIAAIGLVVGGAMYVFGNPHAARILFGVVAGLGLILLSPSIVA
jgi:hypothetical protein